jgi:hypothetical protein
MRCLRYLPTLSTPVDQPPPTSAPPLPSLENHRATTYILPYSSCILPGGKRPFSAHIDRRRHYCAAAGALSAIYLKSNPRPPTPTPRIRVYFRTRPGPPIVHRSFSRISKLERLKHGRIHSFRHGLSLRGIDYVCSFRQHRLANDAVAVDCSGILFFPPWPLSASIGLCWITCRTCAIVAPPRERATGEGPWGESSSRERLGTACFMPPTPWIF